MSDSDVGIELLLLNFSGDMSSGATKGIVPQGPVSCSVGLSGSMEKLMKSKSARQALGGVSFVTRILCCLVSSETVSLKRWDTNPFEISVDKTFVM